MDDRPVAPVRTDPIGDVEQLIVTRRTSLRVDRDCEVPVELVDRLCRLVTWAPNHKQTWPWRVAVFTGKGRSVLGNTIADQLDPTTFDKPERIEKFRVKYLRAPVVVAVGSAPGTSALRTAENRDAVAAGVQNLLLGATAAGLASFWSSSNLAADVGVAGLCGWEAGTQVVALVYLGWPTEPVPAPHRPPLVITRLDGQAPAGWEPSGRTS